MKRILLSMLLSSSVSLAFAGPSLNVGAIYDYMEGDKSSYLKRIMNAGTSTAFVRVNILEMNLDEQGNLVEKAIDTQAQAAIEKQGLVASPARMIIPANGMQATRLLYIGERVKERYYRVRFIPVIPDKEDSFDVSDAERDAYKKLMSAGINIMTGYGAIFFVRPKSVYFDTQTQERGTEYTVKNGGNSTIILDDFKGCSVKVANDCGVNKKHHILPGQMFTFIKEPETKYEYNLIEGNSKAIVKVGM